MYYFYGMYSTDLFENIQQNLCIWKGANPVGIVYFIIDQFNKLNLRFSKCTLSISKYFLIRQNEKCEFVELFC